MCKRLFPLLLVLGLALAATPRRAEASGSVTISFFYDELSPHGDWVTAGSYGRCWRPRGISRDWQPYSNGEWVYTEDGWTWVSNDPWGGDPYHYGTWSRSDAYGWFWIPGTIWAPAWVTWSMSDSYIGWAPVPTSFNVSATGYYGRAVTVSKTFYVFVPTTQFVGVNVGTVRVPISQNSTYLARTQPATRFTASAGVLTSGGPSVTQVERASNRSVSKVGLADARTKAVPFEDGLRGGRGHVIAPAAERAKHIAPTARHAATAPAPRQAVTVTREASKATHTSKPTHSSKPTHTSRPTHTSTHISQSPPAQHGKATSSRASTVAPAEKRSVTHERSAPSQGHAQPAKSQTEHARAEPAASRARPEAPAHEKHARPAARAEAANPAIHQAPPHAETHQPRAAQGGKSQTPKKEHGHEKTE